MLAILDRMAGLRQGDHVFLAHAVSNKVEAAYRRGDLFEKRRQLMDAWARYCTTPTATGKVLPIRRGKA